MTSKKKTSEQQAVAVDQLSSVKSVQEKHENDNGMVGFPKHSPDFEKSEQKTEEKAEEKVGDKDSPKSTDDVVAEGTVEDVFVKDTVDEDEAVECPGGPDLLEKEPEKDSETESEKEHPKKLNGKMSLPIFETVQKCPAEKCPAEKESEADEASAQDEEMDESKRGDKRKSV